MADRPITSVAIAAALALSAFTLPASAQTAPLQPAAATGSQNFQLSAAEVAYRQKMQRVLAAVATPDGVTLSKECDIRGIAFTTAIRSINKDPRVRSVMVDVDEEYLMKVADYAACREETTDKIIPVATKDQWLFYRLMLGDGVIPAFEPKPVGEFARSLKAVGKVSVLN